MDCSLPGFSVHGVLQASILEWVAMPSPRGFSQPPGKPKNTGVGRLYPLQGIFSTQESNWGLLHCRRILYQLRYQGVQTSVFLFSCLVVSDCFATPWTVALQAPLSIGLYRQEYWSGLLFPTPETSITTHLKETHFPMPVSIFSKKSIT